MSPTTKSFTTFTEQAFKKLHDCEHATLATLRGMQDREQAKLNIEKSNAISHEMVAISTFMSEILAAHRNFKREIEKI